MHIRFIFVILVILGVNSYAFGQAKPVEQSSAKIAAVNELLKVMRIDETYSQTVIALVDNMMTRLPPKARDRQKLITFFTKHVGWAALKDDFVRIYAETYTEQDVKNIIQFYKTPTGQKTIAAMPVLAKKRGWSLVRLKYKLQFQS